MSSCSESRKCLAELDLLEIIILGLRCGNMSRCSESIKCLAELDF